MASRQVSKKLVLGLVAIIVVSGVVYGILLLTKDDTSKNVATPVTAPKSTNATTPSSVVKSADQYDGKEISLTGTITQLGSADAPKYYIVSQEDATSSAVLLDFSGSNIDPTKYANVASTGTPSAKVTPKGPYTVTGKMKSAKNQAPTLIVNSIKE
jgi:hypothetical protein